MTDIIINGCLGRMGRVISDMIKDEYSIEKRGIDRACRVVFGVDPKATSGEEYSIYKKFGAECGNAAPGAVIIDFSHPSALESVLAYATTESKPVVIATTGLCPSHMDMLKKAAESIPVFQSANMSVGICLLKELVKRASDFLDEDFDIEIVEKHHNQKLDAPSGTALAIADAINEGNTDRYSYIYDRHSRSAKRGKHEIGISSVRGGNIIGDHEVIFAGNNEVIEINHRAISRNIFAGGAIKAAIFLKDKPAGLYDMTSLLKG